MKNHHSTSPLIGLQPFETITALQYLEQEGQTLLHSYLKVAATKNKALRHYLEKAVAAWRKVENDQDWWLEQEEQKLSSHPSGLSKESDPAYWLSIAR